jgi:hypothetical protein
LPCKIVTGKSTENVIETEGEIKSWMRPDETGFISCIIHLVQKEDEDDILALTIALII